MSKYINTKQYMVYYTGGHFNKYTQTYGRWVNTSILNSTWSIIQVATLINTRKLTEDEYTEYSSKAAAATTAAIPPNSATAAETTVTIATPIHWLVHVLLVGMRTDEQKHAQQTKHAEEEKFHLCWVAEDGKIKLS